MRWLSGCHFNCVAYSVVVVNHIHVVVIDSVTDANGWCSNWYWWCSCHCYCFYCCCCCVFLFIYFFLHFGLLLLLYAVDAVDVVHEICADIFIATLDTSDDDCLRHTLKNYYHPPEKKNNNNADKFKSCEIKFIHAITRVPTSGSWECTILPLPLEQIKNYKLKTSTLTPPTADRRPPTDAPHPTHISADSWRRVPNAGNSMMSVHFRLGNVTYAHTCCCCCCKLSCI